MAAPNWNSRPQDYCDQAKRRAIAALHSKHAHGLTALEKAYLKSLRGRPHQPRRTMTHEQMLEERLMQLLMTIKNEDTSEMLVAEYERIHREVTQIQEEREFK